MITKKFWFTLIPWILGFIFFTKLTLFAAAAFGIIYLHHFVFRFRFRFCEKDMFMFLAFPALVKLLYVLKLFVRSFGLNLVFWHTVIFLFVVLFVSPDQTSVESIFAKMEILQCCFLMRPRPYILKDPQ